MNKVKEYFCRNCNKTFQIVMNDEKVICPMCNSYDVIKVASSPKKIEWIKCDCSCKGGKK